jgi:hypothetical protein
MPPEALEAGYTMLRWNIVFNFVVRLVALGIGASCMYFGLRLYTAGISKVKARHGRVEASWGDKRFLLSNAAPGAFFALTGVTIVLAVVLTLRPVTSSLQPGRTQQPDKVEQARSNRGGG